MIQAWRYRATAGSKRFDRQLVRLVVLAGDSFGEPSDGAAPTGPGGSLAVRAASGLLTTGDYLTMPDGRSYKVISGRGLSPFFHLSEHDLERTRQSAFSLA